jgi:radical SAM protein with 4Fe4S-binding SPASM domain
VDRNGFVHTPRTVCSLPFFTMMVHTNGDVLPCCDGKPIILGNVHSQTLQEIFTGEKLRKFQKMQLRGQRCNNAACRECFGPNDDVQSSDALDGAAAEILARLEK